jgi:hypothetical protein
MNDKEEGRRDFVGSGASKTKEEGARGKAWRGGMESGGGVSKSGAWRRGRERESEEGREGERGKGSPWNQSGPWERPGPINGPEASRAKTLPSVQTSLVKVVAREASGVDTCRPRDMAVLAPRGGT